MTPNEPATSTKPRILTGDTPTGRLHLGHWVGSLENRVKLQQQYDCFFLIANMHAYTTRADKPADIRESTIEIVKDWIACGMDPQRATFVLQTEIPAIAELTWFLAMLLPFNRVMRNPTLKTELETKGLGENYSFGFPMYTVGQCADILIFRPALVPVGEDQLAHIEPCREVARRFNQIYCGVDPHTEDADYVARGGLFPIPQALVGRVARLVGTDGTNKMSKSLNNAIFLSDDAKTVKKKINAIYPGQTRQPNEPGDPDINPVFMYADAFMHDPAEVDALRGRYRRGDNLGDGHVKAAVIDAVNTLLEPMRARRAALEGPAGDAKVLDLLRDHTRKANAAAEETLYEAKKAMRLDFGRRTLGF
jgi:tryptophanyl-tRNA synthetase